VLDLRRPELQRNIALRHRLMQRARRYFDSLGFLEIETRSSPSRRRGSAGLPGAEPGARGEFFALPQSPQIYKQLLMVAGFDRTFRSPAVFATKI